MKYVNWVLLLFLFSSCSAYYQFSQAVREEENHRAYSLTVGKENSEFNAYKDYYHDTVVLEQVYLTKKEERRLKNHLTQNRRGLQILFLLNDTDYYLNIIGYYHPDLFLKEIKTPKEEFSVIPLTQGKGFKYIFNQKPVAEFFIPYGFGILHFTAVGNPQVYENNPNRFERELDYVFFVLNSDKFRLRP